MESPLSKANIAEIRKAAALAADAALKCERAKAAGVPVEEHEVRCGQLQGSLQQLLDIYDKGKNWQVPKSEEK